MFKIDFKEAYNLPKGDWERQVKEINKKIETTKNDQEGFLGWIDYLENEAQVIEETLILGKSLRKYEALVVIGIGGSFLGAKAAYEIFKDRDREKGAELIFLGKSLSGRELKTVLNRLKNLDFAVNVISKSGGTLEPALAFRMVLELLEEKYGAGFKERLILTTDGNQGNLRALGIEEGYRILPIPGNIGGRYSVFTPVGILPLTAAGIDCASMLGGVRMAKEDFSKENLDENLAYQYSVYRRNAELAGKKVEVFTIYDPSFSYYLEWLKQLFGESEGKEGRGLYPMGVLNTRDLHSLGQFIQEGTQEHFETILWVNDDVEISFHKDRQNFDGLEYLQGVSVDEVNKKAMLGTRAAHFMGGIPNILIDVSEVTPQTFGYLSYFFMKACAMTCYLLEVNPFDQPGVEVYKKEIKKLLKGE